MIKKIVLGFVVITYLAGCTHTQVQTKDIADSRLTCTEIAVQTAEVKGVLRDIDDKTGFSGRNVGLGLLFWPGIFVNQMNAGDARKAANERLGVLADLAKEKQCK